ncbi:XRE family transcriptional regulator [Pseudomonas syringae group genomosp. 7]|uniref:XRE family transcriptional regulator n=1 Tax=Pseudomonas syringae group genomosp. 7 TaxID=251699 RepID=UPI000EFFA0C0|nr:XRE family transcriptional regulator [Pseudomonas syringae group genomosp. 7]
MNELLGQRIKRLRKAAGMSQAQLADACGWKSQSRVGNYEAGTREPTFADMETMAKALRVDKSELLLDASYTLAPGDRVANLDNWVGNQPASVADIVRQMLTKQGKSLSESARSKLLAAAVEADSPFDSDQPLIPTSYANLRPRKEEILIPQYDVRGAMGHGQVPADYNEAVRNLVVREEILREKGVSYTSPSALAMITGWGQSMEGTINDKDLVIVDRGINDFVGEGIYLLTWHQELYIKRTMRLDEDHYRLISDNQHYENQTARIDDVTIHAKVLLIWNARKA